MTDIIQIKDIEYVMKAHTEKPRKPENKVRRWDQKTPFFTHVLWCAMTIASEINLDEKIRHEGTLVLLYHDILEDTTAELPEWLSEEVKKKVGQMTEEEHEGHIERMWKKPIEIKLLKLYDRLHSLMEPVWEGEELEKRKEWVGRLASEVEDEYGELNIVRIAKQFI